MEKDLTTLFTGRHCEVLDEVDSTNTWLASRLRNERLPEGAVIRAIRQFSGRGQAGKSWESEAGKNLILSFVFYPGFLSLKDVFLLNMTFALGVYDFAKLYLGDQSSIKWPNDIYFGDSKIGGMLIENNINGQQLSHSILGIGLNVNQEQFSKEIPNPSSFRLIKGRDYNLDQLLATLCSCIESRYLQLKRGDFDEIRSAYHAVLYARNEWKMFESDGRKFTAKILGVDGSGKLLVEDEKNNVSTYDLKQISFAR